jgi:hypothetical protein
MNPSTMRLNRRNMPRSIFRGNELMRLMTMVVMLGVLLLLIFRSRDPSTWAWLVGDDRAVQKRSAAPPEVNPNNEIQSEPTMPALAGPTDLDPEESEAIAEEFQAVADGKLSIQPEEMPSYNRLLRWVGNQTLSEMRSRAKKDFVYTQFYQSPEKYRGQLFEMELNVRRILKYTHNDLTLYEVWGWTAESRSWPYVGVVLDLPKGMPIGPDVYETATLTGYFFKMQGYQPADAKPNAAALQAPLFIGRLIWHKDTISQKQSSDWSWGLYILAGFVIFLIIRWGLFLHGQRRGSYSAPTVQKVSENPVDEWLANVESGDSAKKNDDDADSKTTL